MLPQTSKFVWIQPTTAAVTSAPFDSQAADAITVAADELAGGETVTLQFLAGSTAKQVTLLDGTPINLTSTLSGVELEGGPYYVFVKSATVSACAVYVTPKLTT